MTSPTDPHQDAHPQPAPHRTGNEYPLLDIPFSAVIDGRRYTGDGISLVEAEVSGLVDPAIDGTERVVHLIFEFPGFQIVLAPAARISRNRDNGFELVFTEPTGDHHAQLRQVLNDYISGDLTSSGDLIRSADLTRGDVPRHPADAKPGFAARARRVLGTLMVLLLAAILVATAAYLVDRRVFTTNITTPARVMPAGQTLRATADGQLSFVDLEAGEGDVLYAIDTSDGETLTIAMPCDCTARPINATPGDTVLAGDAVAAVASEDAGLVIEAEVPRAMIYEIERAGGVRAELSDGTTFTASLAEGAHIPSGGAPDDYATLTFAPDSGLPEGAAGRIARLSVSHDPFGPALRRAEAGLNELETLIQ
ncbi:hypothetical protein [Maritimibacter sp. UBA3975]|uniref:hypothetical protein n=1 Tax=Maritimibacter sp. UBA3975 TaxID=1946833 RepID=UPI000C0B0E41|nr:hypothetical protein [Maritimibacter sp. UBA3975]MAM62973.1 hypothetical protein [Maritimibacter sp.]|tara:strand:+ start:2343 stop:3440 length:1098 start_codon:yes stop_codon:yes gene_type:complete